MVIAGKDRDSGPRILPKPAKGASSAAKSHPSARGRSSIPGAEARTNGKESDAADASDKRKAALRKSRRLQNAKLRRSSRLLKRKKRTNIFDGLSFSSVQADLKAVSNIKKKRRLALSNISRRAIFSQSQKKQPPLLHRNLTEIQEEYGEETPENENDQDSDCGQSIDAKTSRASSLYNESRANDFFKSSLRISALGPNTTLHGGFRPRSSPWLRKAESDDDSDDSDSPLPPKCRPLNQDRLHRGAGLADIDPMAIDQTVGFESIGGLSGHIASLKEMVVFPLLYQEVFENFKIRPSRGCLFHGPPGTGKTLVARALANECSHGSRKVSFFMRKGADCMTKWVGESERQLRLLFEQAYQMRPSIIFFDEIDGLAPVRSSRQDQIHSSIVSTLLAMMDGLDDRGEVVVIGATNRLDNIDPALRRPGRFDREFLFGLPDQQARKDILTIHTRQWNPAPSDEFLEELAHKCVGYSGADLHGLCTEAALCALRRRYPQIYSTSLKLQLDLGSITVTSADFMNAMKRMNPASQRGNATAATPLTATIKPLVSAILQGALERLQRLFPLALLYMKRRREETDLTPGFHDDGVMDSSVSCSVSSKGQTRDFLDFTRSAVRSPTTHRPRLLLVGRPTSGLSSHVAPALLHALEKFPVHSLESTILHGTSSVTPEEACAQTFREARRSAPSVLYLPHLQQWWDTAGSALRSSFLNLLSGIPPSCPILLLATSDIPPDDLNLEIQTLFREEYGEVFSLTVPSETERRDFLEDLILRQTTEAPPPTATMEHIEVLPLAPPPPPRQLTEQERNQLEREEEDLQRELRLFLRQVTERLTFDRRFKMFIKPVDMEKIKDYRRVVRKPMDLSTLLTNIDKHRYITVSEYIADADLIWKNALKYNPESGAVERNIRHRAFALKDTLHAIIREELDEDFERDCEEVKLRRLQRASVLDSDPEKALRLSTLKKKRRKSKWSNGVLPKPKKKKYDDAVAEAISAHSSNSCSSQSSLSELLKSGHVPETGLGLTNGHSPTDTPTKFSTPSNALVTSPKPLPATPIKSQTTATPNKPRITAIPIKRQAVITPAKCRTAATPKKFPKPPKPYKLTSSQTKATPKPQKQQKPRALAKQRSVTKPQGVSKPRRVEKPKAVTKLRTMAKPQGMGKPRNVTKPRAEAKPRTVACPRSKNMEHHKKTAKKQQKKHLQLLKDKTSRKTSEPVKVDQRQLQELLQFAVVNTEGVEVDPLEKLYALLSQCIYRHRDNSDKTALIREMKKEMLKFCGFD